MTLRLYVTAAVAALVMASCSESRPSGGEAVPRARAFARIDTYDTVYREVDSLPVKTLVNAGAIVSPVSKNGPGSYSVDIKYPRYKASIYLSLIVLPSPDAGRIKSLTDNRLERIALNVGNIQASSDGSVNDNGFSTLTVITRDAAPTPVQLVASDQKRFFVSATAFIDYQPSPLATDSLRPVIDALAADMRVMADSLKSGL